MTTTQLDQRDQPHPPPDPGPEAGPAGPILKRWPRAIFHLSEAATALAPAGTADRTLRLTADAVPSVPVPWWALLWLTAPATAAVRVFGPRLPGALSTLLTTRDEALSRFEQWASLPHQADNNNTDDDDEETP